MCFTKYKVMGEKLLIDDFGLCQFKLRHKKSMEGKNWFWIYVTVIDSDKFRLLLRDNEGQEYYPLKKDIKRFEKCELKMQVE